jgi:hypothetical protein
VIGKVCQRGQRVSGLLHYLYATGPAQQEGRNRRNPHVDPRLVGGFDDPVELEPTVASPAGGTSAGWSRCSTSRWPPPGSAGTSARSTTW